MLSSSSPFLYSFALFLSLFLLLLFAPQFFPLRKQPSPISLQDELDDLHLFHQATVVSSLKVSHLGITHPKPKIAFLFLTNSDLVFAPLWERFFQGHNQFYNIYIHAYPSSKVPPPKWAISANFIPTKRTERASATLISAERRLLARAILDDPLNLYFALVSQHCIPLHSFQYIYKSLIGNPAEASRAFLSHPSHKSFIEILSNEPTLQNRYIARGKNAMLPEVTFEQFKVGSQFFILSKRHALLILKERKLWRKFRLPCVDLNSCYPEEHYFPTLLSMADPEGCSHYTLTRVNWTNSVGGHPHTYHALEVSPELIHILRESNSSYSYFFARKFLPETLTPLMEIADSVIFRD
ncbi:hypothetical protein SLE2022_067250 [Rubroshorea leprosula]